MSQNMQHGKAWEAAIARSLPDRAVYTRIPDAGPAARAASQAGATMRFSARRPYDARIDWWRGHSLALEAKSTAGTKYAVPPRTREQIAAMAAFEIKTGVPALLLLELRGADESERWWWASCAAIDLWRSYSGRWTIHLEDLPSLGESIARAPKGRTKLYLDLAPMLEELE